MVLLMGNVEESESGGHTGVLVLGTWKKTEKQNNMDIFVLERQL
jgi:hypothetical protein